MSAYALDIAWNGGSFDDRRFKRILLFTLLAFLAGSIAVTVLPVFKAERPPIEEVPKRIAKLVLQKRKPTPPPPPPKVEKPQPKPKKPEPEKVEKPKPVTKKEPPKSKEPPKPQAKPEPSARQQAERAGIMAFRDTLAELRQDPSVAKLDGGKRLSTAGKTARKTERSIVTSKVGNSSGGIDAAALSRDTGSTQLATRTTEKLEAPTELKRAAKKRNRSGKLASRTDEEIQLVFDRNKTAIYNLYNRALRTNPAMRGKVVIRLTISPDGSVTGIEVVSSELGDKKLERKLALRVKRFRFQPKNVASTTLNYTMDFFPS